MRVTIIPVLLFLLPCAINTFGQQAVSLPGNTRTDWWDDVDGFLNQQSALSLNLTEESLRLNTPSMNETREMRMALMVLDNVMHLEKAP